MKNALAKKTRANLHSGFLYLVGVTLTPIFIRDFFIRCYPRTALRTYIIYYKKQFVNTFLPFFCIIFLWCWVVLSGIEWY